MRLNLPELDESSLECWLSVLADNELPTTERGDLIDFLELHPEHWRDCAVMLLDSQRLAQDINAPEINPAAALAATAFADRVFACSPAGRAELPVRYEAAKPHFHGQKQGAARLGLTWAVSCTLAAVAFGLGWWFAQRPISDQWASLNAELRQARESIDELSIGWAAERETLRSLSDLFPDLPSVVEIENTASRTVYLTDRPVSEEMIKSFVATGRTIKVRPYQPEVATTMWRSLKKPVVAIEVYKFVPWLLDNGEL
jgi:hypothetical protein